MSITKRDAYSFWKNFLPVTIEGQDRLPVITLTVGGRYKDEDNTRFAIFGAEIIDREHGTHEIVARDRSGGTDFEHSPAYMARLTLAGLRYVSMGCDDVVLSAHLIEADYYGNGQTFKDADNDSMGEPYPCDRDNYPCKGEHLINLPHSPPQHNILPTRVEITIEYLGKKARAKLLTERTASSDNAVASRRAAITARNERIAIEQARLDAQAAAKAKKDVDA